MALIRTLFWFALFLAFTFGFVVLFDNGTVNYVENAKREFAALQKLVETKQSKKTDESDKIK